MHFIKVRSLVSTMALFIPTHFFAYNGNGHEDIIVNFTLNFMIQNALKAILSKELSKTILSIILFSTLSGLPH